MWLCTHDASWKNSIIVEGPALHAQTAEPVGILQSFDPVKTTNLKSGVQVFDLGQNMSGIPEISVKGKRGDTIKIIPSELLHPDGSANQDATGKQHYYQYILKGDGIVTTPVNSGEAIGAFKLILFDKEAVSTFNK